MVVTWLDGTRMVVIWWLCLDIRHCRRRSSLDTLHHLRVLHRHVLPTDLRGRYRAGDHLVRWRPSASDSAGQRGGKQSTTIHHPIRRHTVQHCLFDLHDRTETIVFRARECLYSHAQPSRVVSTLGDLQIFREQWVKIFGDVECGIVSKHSEQSCTIKDLWRGDGI